MSLLRLFFCVAGIYASYLLWGIAQERLASPFPRYPPHSQTDPSHPGSHTSQDRFPSSAFITTCQALASCTCALIYLLVERSRKGGKGDFKTLVGWKQEDIPSTSNGSMTNGHGKEPNGTSAIDKVKQAAPPPTSWTRSLPALLLRVGICQALAAPIGFMSLRYISYPTMVLAKSCKLIPVLLLNVVLYRRKFKPYKYVVVLLVSIGISMFMFFGKSSKKSKGGGNSSFGLALLGFNLILDGLTASTQDELFALYPRFTGKQLMFTMSFLTLCLSLPVLMVPPAWPSIVVHAIARTLNLPELLSLTGVPPHMQNTPSEPVMFQSLHFLSTHPSALWPLAQYALLGGLGQLFIFETISHFGSLTLVMVTVTRKLFTMLLSVFVFGHSLTLGQWSGIGVVFAAIGLEAGVKRSEIMTKKIADEKKKSRLKAL